MIKQKKKSNNNLLMKLCKFRKIITKKEIVGSYCICQIIVIINIYCVQYFFKLKTKLTIFQNINKHLFFFVYECPRNVNNYTIDQYT